LALSQDKASVPVETLKMVATKTLDTMPISDRHVMAVYAQVMGLQQKSFMVPVRHDPSGKAEHLAPKA
jgi:hypothetical protein